MVQNCTKVTVYVVMFAHVFAKLVSLQDMLELQDIAIADIVPPAGMESH